MGMVNASARVDHRLYGQRDLKGSETNRRNEMTTKRTSTRWWLTAGVLGAFLTGSVMTASTALADEGMAFPHYPSYITAKDGRSVAPGDWMDPQVCAGCHPRQAAGWRTSMHANSFRDIVFQAEWALGVTATDGGVKNLCGGCHTPVGVVTGLVEFDPNMGKHGGFTTTGVANNGVFCDMCHTVSGSSWRYTATGEPGNASLILDPGNVKRATLGDSKSPFHETAYSDLHARASYCANCHNIFHPEHGFPIEYTYDEWKVSPYAHRGIQCQDCHMVPVATAMRVADEMKRPHDLENHGLEGFAGMGGPMRDLVHDHGFVGGNSVVAEAMGVPGADAVKGEAIKRLQNAVDLDFEMYPGKQGANLLKVKVTNTRAGHQLPTSLTFIRQVWLEVEVKDDQGRLLLSSGKLDEGNNIPGEAVKFINTSVDSEGRPTVNPWEVAGFSHVNTIPPKGHRYGAYAFVVPDGAETFTITARLNYQSYTQELTDYLMGEGALTVPTIMMEELVQTFDANTMKRVDVEQDTRVVQR